MDDLQLMPHGQCFLWNKNLIFLHVLGDSLIALAYFSIPLTLYILVRKRPQFDLNWIVLLFCSFIVFCGFTHTVMIWNFWNADYWASGLLKLATGFISVITAILLWPLIPKLLKLPTLRELDDYKKRLFQMAQSLSQVTDLHSDSPTYKIDTEKDMEFHLDQLQISSTKMKSLNKSMSHFFSHFSHEVRGPLNSIMGYSEVLKLDPGLSAENNKCLDSINTSCEYISDLITDVLDYSKIVAGKLDIVPSKVEVRQTINSLTASLAGQIARKNLNLKVHFGPHVPAFITIDELRLKQLLSNLIGNSIKYTNTGSIDVHVDWHSEDDTKGTLILVISDTGIGISHELQEIIFDPFETGHRETDQRSKSSGLGLALCRGIAKELQGTVELVRSEPGLGSVFKVQLTAVAT